MRGPLDVVRQLLAADLPHEIVHLRRRIQSADELAEALGVPAGSCVLTEVFEADGDYVVTLVPADCAVVESRLAAAVRRPAVRRPAVRRPDPAVASRVTDYTARLIAPVALAQPLPVLADLRLGGDRVLYTATGNSSTALKIHGDDLLAAAGARLADLAEPLPLVEAQFRVGSAYEDVSAVLPLA